MRDSQLVRGSCVKPWKLKLPLCCSASPFAVDPRSSILMPAPPQRGESLLRPLKRAEKGADLQLLGLRTSYSSCEIRPVYPGMDALFHLLMHHLKNNVWHLMIAGIWAISFRKGRLSFHVTHGHRLSDRDVQEVVSCCTGLPVNGATSHLELAFFFVWFSSSVWVLPSCCLICIIVDSTCRSGALLSSKICNPIEATLAFVSPDDRPWWWEPRWSWSGSSPPRNVFDSGGWALQGRGLF